MKKRELDYLITEEIKTFLKEAEEETEEKDEVEVEEKPESKEGGGLIDISAGPEAILKTVAKIPQNILQAGTTDGKPDDEKIQIVDDTALASDLIPTQSQIGSKQSLDDQIEDKDFGKGSTQLDQALKGGMIASKGGSFPILTFGKKYILDGHHRWSQFLASNPSAKVNIANISAPGVDNSDEALALTHIILFALYGKSPTKPFEGENLIGKGAEWVKKYVMEKIVDSAIKKLYDKKKIEKPEKELAAAYYAKNLGGLKGGKHDRTAMPQGADAGDKSGLTDIPKSAALGKVNYIEPKKSDVKERMTETKRWQKLAGIN